MLTPNFALNQVAEVKRFIRQGISAPEYGASEWLRCRFNFSRQYSGSGSTPTETVSGSGTVWFAAGVRLKPLDVIIFNEQRYNIISCQPSYDWLGKENHVECVLK